MPVRTEMYLVLRWWSALPVRQALALSEFGREGLSSPAALELLEHEPEEHVLEIGGLLTTMRGANEIEKDLKTTALLWAPSLKPLRPSGVRVPAHGMHLLATLRFPHISNLRAEDGSVRISGSVGASKFEQRFKLGEMTYRGRLEL